MIVLAGGATKPRDLSIPGRELKGIHFAMEFLPLQNKKNQGDQIPDDKFISAKDKLYERFAPQTHLGVADPNGIRQFIVGTGGRTSLDAMPAGKPPTLETIDNSTQGVLKLTLGDSSYSWEFIPVAGGTFKDSGTTACH